MPTIGKPALQDLYRQVTSGQQKVDASVLDRIVAIIGDKKGFVGLGAVRSEAIATRLQNERLTPEQKLAIAKKGLDAQETADLKAILNDPAFAAKLDPAAANFLKAIVGLEPLRGVDMMGAPAAVRADPSSPEVQAAAKLKELIKSGEIRKYYDVMIGAKDDPALKAEAEALFNKLPVVKPGMSGEDFVKAGLWTVAPRGIEAMQKSARYLPGRQVLVETTLRSDVPARGDASYEAKRRDIGTYDPSGTNAVTYRAVLKGQDPAKPNNFIVLVDKPGGGQTELSVTKESVFRHNQPHQLDRDLIHSDTNRDLPYNGTSWNMDYKSALAKAKLCEIAILMDEHVQKLDFTKMNTEASGGLLGVRLGGSGAKKMVELQKSCVEIVFRSIDMRYPHGTEDTSNGRAPSTVRDVARQAIRGTGMCVQQSTVFGGLLMPFMDILGVDGQYRSGNCFRNIRGATNNVYAPDGESGHGWWQITFRPSMEMTVTDRTWNQVNYTLDLAYGFPYGDRYAKYNIGGFEPAPTKPTDVNVSGDVTVETMERQFSKVGDGRENHISLTQDNPRD